MTAPWPEGSTGILRAVHAQLEGELPDNAQVHVNTNGWELSVSWEGGIGFDEVAALVSGLEGDWGQSEDDTAIFEAPRGTVYLYRTPHPRAQAYSLMSAEYTWRCQCREGGGLPYEAEDQYSDLAARRESHRVEAHPTLATAGIPVAQLERMAELLEALLPEDLDAVAYLSEEYCKLGHLEGLRALEESLSK